MFLFYLVVCTLVNFMLLAIYVTKVPIRLWLVNPIGALMAVDCVALPLRYWCESSGFILPKETMTDAHTIALAYTTLFNSVLFFTIFAINGSGRKVDPDRCKSMAPGALRQTTTIMLLLFSFVVVSYVVGVATGVFSGLGDETKERGYSPLENLIRLVYEMRWFVLGIAFALYVAKGDKTALGVLIAQVLLNFGYSVMYGGRGHSLVSFYIIATALLSRQDDARSFFAKVRKFYRLGFLAAGVAFLILFVSTVRRQGVYDDNQLSLPQVYRQSGEITKDMMGQIGDLIESAINRLTTNAIMFVEMVKSCPPNQDKGDYPYGSITDLRKMIPSFAYTFVTRKEKPKITFNYWMSHYIVGRNSYTEFDLPIGREAESFYALRWAGLSYAVLYGIVFGLMYRWLYTQSNSLLFHAWYFWLLFAYIRLGAACMTNRLPIVLQVGIMLLPFFWVLRYHHFRPAMKGYPAGVLPRKPQLARL